MLKRQNNQKVRIVAGWPPDVAIDKTVLLVEMVKGKAYVEREGNQYIIESFTQSERVTKRRKPLRVAVAHEDYFWLEPGSVADISIVDSDGNVLKPRRFGRDYYERAVLEKRYSKLTNAQFLIIRNLLCNSGNGKPLNNSNLIKVILPIEEMYVRFNYIPYRIGRKFTSKIQIIEAIYMANDNEILLGHWPINSSGNGHVVLDKKKTINNLKSTIIKKIEWNNTDIPIVIRFIGKNRFVFPVYNVIISHDSSENAVESQFYELDKAIISGDDWRVANTLAYVERYQCEIISRLANVDTQKHPYISIILEEYCNRRGIDFKMIIEGARSSLNS